MAENEFAVDKTFLGMKFKLIIMNLIDQNEKHSIKIIRKTYNCQWKIDKMNNYTLYNGQHDISNILIRREIMQHMFQSLL